GPMYKVFNDEELAIWEDWVVWLGKKDAPPVESDPAKLMALVIDTLRQRQQGVPDHQSRTLTGPNPAGAPDSITQSVAKWFEGPTRALMEALSDPTNGWITKGQPQKS